MKKLVSFLLTLALLLGSVSALAAYNDHTDYVDWPIVKDGEKLTVSVATKRSEQYGKDPDQQWFVRMIAQPGADLRSRPPAARRGDETRRLLAGVACSVLAFAAHAQALQESFDLSVPVAPTPATAACGKAAPDPTSAEGSQRVNT